MEASNLFSGRIKSTPDEILNQEVLKPQFEYEVAHLLPFYLLIEKVSVHEAYIMGIMSMDEAKSIVVALNQIDTATLQASPTRNLSDISFAIESAVAERIKEVVPTWHVDKSRNDFQACAQRMLARKKILENVSMLEQLGEAIVKLAERSFHFPMPGYTHYQAAQIISPGFYLASINESVLGALERLLHVYDDLNCCPLGAGAMAGLHLPWNRQRMAEQLGFNGVVPSALSSVANRDWTLKISFEYALLGTALSRFCTDLSLWGSSEFGFIDLPDELASISSAMPQKRNLTILERIRGETAHLIALHVDFMIGQRNTPYTNLVEVSKEAGRYLISLFQHADRILLLLILVIEKLMFRPERMRYACEQEYYGGFALANILTLQSKIPYRTAQVITGEFIRSAIANQIPPARLLLKDLQEIVACHGHNLNLSQLQLCDLFDVMANLEGKQSDGSTNPVHVANMLDEQKRNITFLKLEWSNREKRILSSLARDNDYYYTK